MHELREAHRLGEKLHPAVHLAELDVADDVIDGGEADGASGAAAAASRGWKPGAKSPA